MIRALVLAALLVPTWAMAQQPTSQAGISSTVTAGPTGTTSVLTIGDCCTIHQDGKVELREGLKLDDASRAFWTAIAQFGMRNCRPVEGTKP